MPTLAYGGSTWVQQFATVIYRQNQILNMQIIQVLLTSTASPCPSCQFSRFILMNANNKAQLRNSLSLLVSAALSLSKGRADNDYDQVNSLDAV